MSVTDAEFWEGSSNNREGWFPANHVQEVRLRDKGIFFKSEVLPQTFIT